VDEDRKTIVERADRILKQSRSLRKMSDELLQESRDIRAAATAQKPTGRNGRRQGGDRGVTRKKRR
jgi:hypothetical protein